MEKTFKPNKKFFTKIMWIQLTITVLTIIGIGLIYLIINLANGKMEGFYVLAIIGVSGIILMWIVSTVISRLWINNLEYMIYEDRVIIRKGILKKNRTKHSFQGDN